MPKLSDKAITDTRIQRAKVKLGKDGNPMTSYLWDSQLRGFGVRITKAGSKTFCFKYTDPNGKPAWMPLGPYTGEQSLIDARARATELRNIRTKGLSPKVEAKRATGVPTIAEFVRLHLLAQKRELRDSSYRGTAYYLEKILVPELGEVRMDQIQRSEFQALVNKVSAGWRPNQKSSDGAEPTPVAGIRFRAAVHTLFEHAIDQEVLPEGFPNPCRQRKGKGKTTVSKKERYLTTLEIQRLGEVLREIAEMNAAAEHPERVIPYVAAALRLLMLTGARLNEILKLKWSQINRERGVIRIVDHKTSRHSGAKELPLNAAVLAVLDGLEALPTRVLGGDWVIQGQKYRSHLVNLQKPWNRIRVEAGIPDVRIHDLRHTFASVGVGLGLSLKQVGDLLGHSQPAVTNRYAHLDADPRLQASEQISSVIASALG